MRTLIYDSVGSAMAIFMGLLGFFAVISGALRDRNFLRREYLQWFACVGAFCMVAPLLYAWGAPARITPADAYLLRIKVAGWTYVLMAYLGMAGICLGGLVAALIWTKESRRSRNRGISNADE